MALSCSRPENNIEDPFYVSVAERSEQFVCFCCFFAFAHRAKLQRQADITLQSQDPTFAMCIDILIFLGSYWQTE